MITKTIQKERGVYPLHNIRVVDGDTIEATIMQDFGCSIIKRIRLKGWWADEPVGPYASSGLIAKHLLEVWVQGKVLWLLSPSGRLDRFGRVIGCLIHGQQIVGAHEVLGQYQLSEAEHKRRRDQAAKAAKGLPSGAPPTGSRDTAEVKSSGPINDPRANLDLTQGLGEWDWTLEPGEPASSHAANPVPQAPPNR